LVGVTATGRKCGLPRLLDPIRIGSLYLRNRIVMPPMATDKATADGRATSHHVEHYTARARGLGLAIVEHCYVQPDGRFGPAQLGIHEDGAVEGLGSIARAVRQMGARVVVQLSHAGAQTGAEVTGGLGPVGPSDVPLPGATTRPRPMTVEEIDGLVASFVAAAGRACEAGFDGVEIHGAHGFLLSQFLSPYTNRRTDAYGGSVEARLALPLRVVREVKAVLGPDKVLLYRLGATDWVEGGLTLDEACAAARALAAQGVDAVDVSGGIGKRPATMEGQGFFIPLAEAVRKAVTVPVCGVGGITDAKFADELIRRGKVDLVAVGRAILTDPEWAMKANVLCRG
jgi:NADPH2 dehydrogenase